MARPSALVSNIRKLEAEIDECVTASGNSSRRGRKLYRELWDVLTGAGEFDQVLECSRKARGLAGRIEERVHRRRGDALGKALLEHTEFGASVARVCRAWGVHRSEWRYLRELAGYLGEKVTRGQRLRRWPSGWVSEIEEYHEEIEVFVEDLALHDMLFGALEAYTVPKGRGSRYTEVYGVCFGSVKARERRERGEGQRKFLHVGVQRVALQLRGKTTAGDFVPDPRSQEVQLEMAAELFPQLDLVGDFHSHPYSNLARLQNGRGWRYSDTDERANQVWIEGLQPKDLRPRVSLILALARGQRRGRSGRHPAPNVLRATIGRCHCYLAAYRINRDGTYSEDNVALRCATITGLGA